MADFEWLRSFAAVYRQGSLSSASSVRFLSQPALSQHIWALEAEIGEPLFLRTNRKMLPTERAARLYHEVAPSIDHLEKINEKLRHPVIPRLLRFGGPSEFMHEGLTGLLPETVFRLAFTFGIAKPLIQSLKDHQIDLLVSTQHLATPGLVFTPLAKETFVLVGNQVPAFPADEESAQRDLERLKWISYAFDLPIIRRFWFGAFGKRCAITPAFLVPDLRIIKTMVLQGMGVSVLPDYLIRTELETGSLKELWTPHNPITNDLWLVYRSSDKADADFMKFVEALLSSCQREISRMQ